MTYADRLLTAIGRSGYTLDDADNLLDRGALERAAAEGPLLSIRSLRGFGAREAWNPLAYAARHVLSSEGQWGALETLVQRATPPLRLDEPAGVPAGATTLGFIGLALLAEWSTLGSKLGAHRLTSTRNLVLQRSPADTLWPLALDTAHAIMQDPLLPKGIGHRVAGAWWDAVKRFVAEPGLCSESTTAALVRDFVSSPWIFHGMYPSQREDAQEWIDQTPLAFAAYLEHTQPASASSRRQRL